MESANGNKRNFIYEKRGMNGAEGQMKIARRRTVTARRCFVLLIRLICVFPWSVLANYKKLQRSLETRITYANRSEQEIQNGYHLTSVNYDISVHFIVNIGTDSKNYLMSYFSEINKMFWK